MYSPFGLGLSLVDAGEDTICVVDLGAFIATLGDVVVVEALVLCTP